MTTLQPPDRRTDPPRTAGEREVLEAFLDYHRETLEMKCEGLDAEQLRRRAVPPSSLSLLGLVRHLADVERKWFRVVFSGEEAPPLHYSADAPDDDFDALEATTPEEAFAAWRSEVDAARAIVAGAASLDAVSVNPDRPPTSLRWILIHMVEEYSRHNGHADFLRERIDGVVGE